LPNPVDYLSQTSPFQWLSHFRGQANRPYCYQGRSKSMVLFDSPQTISYSVVHCNHVAILTVSENRNWPIGILQHVTTAGCIWKCRVYCCVTRCIVQVQLL